MTFGLLDPLGRLIRTIAATCTSGDNSLRLDQLDALPGGLYHYVIRYSSGYASGNLVKR